MQLPASSSSAACGARELWRETLSPLLGAPVWRSVLASMHAHPLLLVPPASASPARHPDVGGGEEVLASLPDLGAARLALEETATTALSSHTPAIFSFAGAFLRCVRILAPALDKGHSDELLRTLLIQNGAFTSTHVHFTVSILFFHFVCALSSL